MPSWPRRAHALQLGDHLLRYHCANLETLCPMTMQPLPNRRQLLQMLAACAGLTAALPASAKATASTVMEVWKDPNCGCCQDWIHHLQANGIQVQVHASGNAAVRARLGLPAELGSCHTGLIGGYIVEGHVPAADVHKLLRQQPQALGITVPGMPIGSPGMDGTVYGGRRDAYDVLLVTRSRWGQGVRTSVFTSYR